MDTEGATVKESQELGALESPSSQFTSCFAVSCVLPCLGSVELVALGNLYMSTVLLFKIILLHFYGAHIFVMTSVLAFVSFPSPFPLMAVLVLSFILYSPTGMGGNKITVPLPYHV